MQDIECIDATFGMHDLSVLVSGCIYGSTTSVVGTKAGHTCFLNTWSTLTLLGNLCLDTSCCCCDVEIKTSRESHDTMLQVCPSQRGEGCGVGAMPDGGGGACQVMGHGGGWDRHEAMKEGGKLAGWG